MFLAIHLFQDGNGRLSRVLVSLLLLKSGYSYIAYAWLESIVEKNKDAYYLALQRTQRTLREDKTDWLPWLRCFLNSLKRQKDHLAEKTEALEQYSALSHESMLIMQHVNSHHRITIRDAENLITTITRPTIKIACLILLHKVCLSVMAKHVELGTASLNSESNKQQETRH